MVPMLGLVGLTVNAVFLGGKTLPDVTPWLVWLAGLLLVRAGLMWGSDIIAQVSANRVKGGCVGS